MNNTHTHEQDQEHISRLRETWKEAEAEREAQRCAEAERNDALSQIFREMKDIFGGLEE